MAKYDDEDDQFSELRELMRQKREQTDSHPSVENSDKNSKEEKEVPADQPAAIQPAESSRKKKTKKSHSVKCGSDTGMRHCSIYLTNQQFENLKWVSRFAKTTISECVSASLSPFLKAKNKEILEKYSIDIIKLIGQDIG